MITWILKRGETLEQLSALKKMLKYDILIISVFHAVSLSQVTLLWINFDLDKSTCSFNCINRHINYVTVGAEEFKTF